MLASSLRNIFGSDNHLPDNFIRLCIKSALIRMAAYIASLAIAILLTRWLQPAGYGIYVYAVTLTGLLSIFCGLGVAPLIVRETSIGKAQGNWAYLRTMLMRSVQMTTLMSLILLALSFYVLWFLSEQLSGQQIETFMWLLWVLPFLALSKVASSMLKGLNHVIAGQIINDILPRALLLMMLGCLFVLFPQTHSPQYVALTRFGMGLVVAGVACFLLWRHLPKTFWRKEVREEGREEGVYGYAQWLRSAFPFALLSWVHLADTRIDILMLGFFQPIEQAGIYRIAVYASVSVLLGLQVVLTVIAPYVAKMYAQKNLRQLQQLVSFCTRVTFACALCLAFILFIFGQDIMVIAFGEEFSTAYVPLAILLVGALVRSAMGPVVLLMNMTGHENYAVRFLLFGMLLNILLNALLIPLWGMVGAALATAISISFRSILLCCVLRIKTQIRSHVFTHVFDHAFDHQKNYPK